MFNKLLISGAVALLSVTGMACLPCDYNPAVKAVYADETEITDQDDIDVMSARRHNISLMSAQTADDVTYDGTPKEPQIILTDENDNILTYGTDYSVSYYDNVNVTDYYKGYRPRAVIEGTGEYFGKQTVYFDILPKNIKNVSYTVDDIEKYSFTGKAIYPYTKVTADNKRMYEDIDYYVTYSNNTAAGKATINIIFMGNYEGTISKKFIILPKPSKIIDYKCKDDSSAQIFWNKTEDADGYVIYKYDADQKKYNEIKNIKGNESLNTKVTGLTKGERVRLSIRSYKVCEDKSVIYSNNVSFSFTAGKQVTSITNLYKESQITLAVKQKRDIVLNIAPVDAYNKKVVFSSSNTSVAKVDSKGVITGVAKGNAVITATSTDGSNVVYSVKVKVTPRAKSFTVNNKNLSIVSVDHQLYSYDEMVSDIELLSNKYSRFISASVLGKSYDNRLIYDIAIGNPKASKQVIIVGTTHAREYMNSQLIMKQIEMYCYYYYNGMYEGKYFSELFDECCIHFVPMLNPDGVTISQYGPQKIKNATLRNNLYTMYKKYGGGTSKSTYFKRWKANGRGVDLNRNYYVKGGKGEFGKGHACDQGYYGACAYSEKETKCLVNLFNKVKPKATISYHSTGSQIYWKYGQSGSHLEKSRILFESVRSLTGYQPIGSVSKGPGFSDWVNSVKGIPAMTVETGKGLCPLYSSEFNSIWNKNQMVPLSMAYNVIRYDM